MSNFKLVVKDQGTANKYWSRFNEKFIQTIPLNPIFNTDSKIFTLGSCFAVEIRKVLKERGFSVFPRLDELELDPDRFLIGNLPDRENFNYYNTFSIEQEFARAVGLWQQQDDDYWQVEDNWWGGDKAFQDPYRRCVFGKTLDDVRHATRLLDSVVHNGMKAADGFLITLGLIEVWKIKHNQRVACMEPGYNEGGGLDETEFYLSDFEENVRNLEHIVEHIGVLNPNANIVFTVSPVPLGRTFTDNDVYVANMESKSLLRTAAAQVCRRHNHVHYFQSYDICNAIKNPFIEDGRHVQPDVVKMIVNGFISSFFSA